MTSVFWWSRYSPASTLKVEVSRAVSKALMQQVFESRLELAECALAAARPDVFKAALRLIRENVGALPEDSIPVREKWRETRVAATKARILTAETRRWRVL